MEWIGLIILLLILCGFFCNQPVESNSCECQESETYCNSYKSQKSKKYLTVHTSEKGLAKKLLKRTGSRRMAKDILVQQYGYSQSGAKHLAGYRGY